MFWIEGFPAAVRRCVLACLLLSVPAWGAMPLQAAESTAPDEPEVWLVTYGPGEIYWQRFGHNAIWVRDARLGLDHTFNFGFFDFEQERFFLRFLLSISIELMYRPPNRFSVLHLLPSARQAV